jgi:DNA-binding NarL/FixJ family response regulator
MQIITIFIAEDHQLVRDAFKITIEKEPNFKIIGEADTCEATLGFCIQNKVDVILMDINLNDGNSISTIKTMLDRIPNVNIVVISMLNVLAIIKDLYKYGVKAYLTKNSSKEQLLEAINKASNNKVYFSPEISQLFLDFEDELIHSLNSKEIKIVQLVCKGFSNKEVANSLNISEKTIEGYKTKIYKKVNVSNNIGMFNFAQKNGLI